MQRTAEDLAAEHLPVGACIDEMQVPDLIDHFRRCHRMARMHREQEEAFVFLDGASGELTRPAIFL